ncbi:MAG: ATP-dependent helicase HrpB [Bacteroidales bacterium]|nr:ATP-dependent helicase HrpB [Bacteroidales bacterium]
MHFSYVTDSTALQLPAARIAEELNRALRARGGAVVTAPPGSGKSTLLPLTMLAGLDAGPYTGADGNAVSGSFPARVHSGPRNGAPSAPGKILMLEPRRLAARQIALRLALLSGTPVGGLIGYRMRLETRVSAATRIEVLTEGILTRMLIEDPTLEGIGMVVFDEFHERSLTSDTTLALVREARRLVRPDLKLVIMSATLDARPLCETLDLPLVKGEGKMFPVKVLRADVESDDRNAAEAVAHVIRQAHRETEGDILAFLPGEAEIRRCAELLGDALFPTHIYPLYGLLPQKEQQEAIAPSPAGSRKVVLATPIAETSLTIEGVRAVVDSGLCRKMEYDPRNGLSGLKTVRISLDMATQRTGRAGRVAPGVCYRLWSAATETRMAAHRTPEILEADLTSVVLDIAAWGAAPVEDLPWLTPPPASSVNAAVRLLTMLGALTEDGALTPVGRKMAAFPCHPRIAHMLVQASDAAHKALACDIAALLEEKDPLAAEGVSADLCLRIAALREARRRKASKGSWGRLTRLSEQYRHLARVDADDSEADPFAVGILVAAAYPERIAHSLEGSYGQYALSSGDRAALDGADALGAYEWLAAADVNVRPGQPGRIYLAAPLSPDILPTLATTRDRIAWDSKRGALIASREERIGMLLLRSRPLGSESREEAVKVLCETARKEGRSMFDWSEEVAREQRRVATVAAWHPELGLPDLDTDAVLERAGEWLPLYAGNATSAAELRRIDLCAALRSLLSYEQQRAVERIAPSHITVPTGSRIAVDYRQGAELPVLRVRLQECFGLVDTPRVDDGRRPVLMELLSPGYKPVQLTTDLASFWKGTYFEVRKELRRRYPKHAWPDDPLAADPVRGVRRK